MRTQPLPLLILVTLVAACDGEGGDPDGLDSHVVDDAVLVTDEPPGDNCPDGGVALTDASGVTEFVCDGPEGAAGPSGAPGATGPSGAEGPEGPAGAPGPEGLPGADGTSVTVVDEPPGANCPTGGVAVTDATGTTYVCTGLDGVEGPEGPQGPPGTSGTGDVVIAVEPPGANCVDGGLALTSATSTAYVCDGVEGAAGPAGVAGPAGPQGPAGDPGPAGADGAPGDHVMPRELLVVAIASWDRDDCASSGEPGRYTLLGSYRDWIREVLEASHDKRKAESQREFDPARWIGKRDDR